MKSRKEHVKVLMDYHRRFYTDSSYPTLFSLKQKMLEFGICPKCGTISRSWSSDSGHFPCWTCGFKISEKELEKVLWDYDDRVSDKMKKSILKKRFKMATQNHNKTPKVVLPTQNNGLKHSLKPISDNLKNGNLEVEDGN